MSAHHVAVLLVCLASGHAAAGGKPASYDCPRQLDVRESAAGAPEGWSASLDGGRAGYPLEGVTFYEGHPKDLASLVPDESATAGSTRTWRWRFSGEAGSEYWIACTYGNTRLLLTRRLDRGTRACEADEELLPSGQVLRLSRVICR